MRLGRATGLVLLFLALLALHFWLRPVLAWRAGIDFLVIAVLLIAVRVRPGRISVMRIAVSASSPRMVSVNMRMPALLAEYAAMSGTMRTALIELTLTT